MINFSVAVFIAKAPTVLYFSQRSTADTHPSPQQMTENEQHKTQKEMNGNLWPMTLEQSHGLVESNKEVFIFTWFWVLRAEFKAPHSINCLLVKHSYHRRVQDLLCSANTQTLWFQDVCSDIRFRPLTLFSLATTALNFNRQLKGCVKQWHHDLTLCHPRKISSTTQLLQQAFLLQWLITLQAIGVRERQHFKKSELKELLGLNWALFC